MYTSWDDDGRTYVSRRVRDARRQRRQDFLHGVMSAGWAWVIVCFIGLIYGAFTNPQPATVLELFIAVVIACVISLLLWNNRRTFLGACGLMVMHVPVLLFIGYVITLITR